MAIQWRSRVRPLTKTVAPGFRLGWVRVGRHTDQVAFLKRATSVDQPEILQRTLVVYLAGGGCERHLRRLRRDFHDRVKTSPIDSRGSVCGWACTGRLYDIAISLRSIEV